MIKPIHILAPYVRHYWVLEDGADVSVSKQTLPTSCIQLVFHRGRRSLLIGKKESQPRALICGRYLNFSGMTPAGKIEMIMVASQPYAARTTLQLPLEFLYGELIVVDAIVNLELSVLSRKVIEADGHETCIRLIEQFPIHRLYRFEGYEYNLRRISAALHQINEQAKTNISGLSETVCLSSRQLNRIFLDYVGATSKKFPRIVRMQWALLKIQQNPSVLFVQLAYECGFSDQSHMIKKFKLSSGYAPTEYFSLYAPCSDYSSE